MKKKLIASITCLSMLLIMLLSSTMAWFTDQKGAQSTMVVGQISIEQTVTTDSKSILPNDPFLHTVTIKNDGTEPCYVRTIFAFEDGDYKDKQVRPQNVLAQIALNDDQKIVIPGVTDTNLPKMQFTVEKDGKPTLYTVGYYVHAMALPAGETITPLKSFTLKNEADKAWGDEVGEKYDILVLSQACQVAGMEGTYKDALNTAFGTITSVKCASWFGTMLGNTVKAQISTADDLVDAIANGDNVVLMNDINAGNIKITKDAKIDLNGNTLTASFEINDAQVVIENGQIVNANADVSAIQANTGALVLNDVEITSARHAVRVEGNCTVTINGGTYKAADSKGKTQHALNVSDGGEVIINGGTFIGPKGTASDSGAAVNVQAGSKVTINGGNFSGGKNSTLSAALDNLTVCGGTFDQDPSAYVAPGYQVVANGDGTYTVVPKVEDVTLSATNFAGIYAGDTAKTYYVFDKTGLMNLNNLFAEIKPNEGNVNTIKLGADIDLTGETWKPINTKLVTFDGNNHTISNLTAGLSTDGRRSGFWAYAGAVTIKNLTLENVNVTGSQAGIFAGAAEALKIENCFLKGNNTVNYVAYIETWSGIGAITGVITNSNINVEIVSGATVTLNRGDMVTAFGCTYIDDLTGHISTNSGGIITNNGTVTATGSMTFAVSSSDELNKAIDGGAKKILLAKGNYTMPSSSTTGTVTITGTKDTVIDVTLGAYLDSANGVTIKGVTIKTGTGKVNGNGSDYAALYAKDVTYINCTFVGPMRVGRDGAKFINCTFTELGNDYIWTYGNDVTFEGCTFNTVGKAILIYSDGGNEISEVTVKNCTFNATQGAKAGAIANQNCAAIEIHNYGNGVKLVTEGNTYDSNFSGEWRIKTYETGRTQVFVNGTEYTTIAIDGKTMTIDANKDVTVNP